MKSPRSFQTLYVTTAAAVLAIVTPAAAIQPAQWVHTAEADFAQGHTENTVVTNLGDVKLATRTRLAGELTEEASVIHDLQTAPNGDLYIAAGPEGSLLIQQHDDKPIQQVLALPGEQVFALAATTDGKLLAAVSSPNTSRLAVLKNDELHTLVELEGVRYIWDVLVDKKKLFVATGPEGKLLKIELDKKNDDGNPTVTELLDAAQPNLLCLGRDAQGRLYAGSDGEGLVYRITLNKDAPAEVFVLYDAPEPEIGAILVMADGTVFAGTADADQAKPGRLEEAATAESGRPETSEPAKGESDPGDMPQVPPEPQPMDDEAPEAPQDEAQPAVRRQHEGVFSHPLSARATQARNDASNPPAPRDMAADAPQSAEQPAATTAQQRDRLRQVIRQRLEKARESGSLQASKPKSSPFRKLGRSKSSKSTQSASRGKQDGNAIYRIDPNGFVTQIFRESVMILKLLEDPSQRGSLLVATGNEGQLFRVNPTAEETTILVDLEPQQVPAMTPLKNGGVLLGTANPAVLVALEAGFAQEGTFTSSVLDATQVSLWGKAHLTTTTPQGATLALQTRSGNVQDPDQAAWSPWSDPQVLQFTTDGNPLQPRELPVDAPPARFLQYKLTLKGAANTSPVADRVQVTYVVPNLKPSITSIHAAYPEADDDSNTTDPPTKASTLEIEWEAADPNGDQLLYTLEYQPAGTDQWLPLAQDLTEQSHEWQTLRIPDGWYTVRLTATDSPSNTGDMTKTAVRRADPVLIDNTPPTISSLEHRVKDGVLWIETQAQDALSAIRRVSYNIDGADPWLPALPQDLIYDSTQESFTLKIPDLSAGPHAVTVRVIDAMGNAYYKALLLEIGKPKH